MTAVADAVSAARRGDLIVFPTDTVYALACRPDDPAATARLFDAKRRAEALTLPVLAPSADVARTVGVFDERADRLMAALWPGALTIVVPRTAASERWELGEARRTIGVRVPRHPLARTVLEATGPLAATSANRSGEPPARTCDELDAAFGDRVSIYLCQDPPLDGEASTVVALAPGYAHLIRAGGIDASTLRELLGSEVPLLDSPPSKVTRSR